MIKTFYAKIGGIYIIKYNIITKSVDSMAEETLYSAVAEREINNRKFGKFLSRILFWISDSNDIDYVLENIFDKISYDSGDDFCTFEPYYVYELSFKYLRGATTDDEARLIDEVM